MFKINGEIYYLDLDRVNELFEIEGNPTKENENADKKVNIIKYDTYMMFMDKLINEPVYEDDSTKNIEDFSCSVGFRVAFNTLFRYKIIKNLDNE